MKLALATFAFVALLSEAAFGQTSIYPMEIEGLPAANSTECEGIASDIGTRLAHLAGVEVYGVECSASGITSGSFDVTVSYFAEERVADVVADDADYATYDSRQDCLADLEVQRRLLEDETSLPVLYAFCSLDGILRMRALGESTVKRWLFSAMVDDFVAFAQIYDGDRLAALLTRALTARGVPVSRVAFSISRIDVYYYGDTELPFGMAHEPRFESAELCLEREADVRAIFEPNVDVVFQFCAETDGLGDAARTLYTFGLQPGPVTPGIFDELDLRLLPTPPDRFTDRTVCEAEIPRVLETYRTRLNLPARAAICSLRWIDYGRTMEILVFE